MQIDKAAHSTRISLGMLEDRMQRFEIPIWNHLGDLSCAVTLVTMQVRFQKQDDKNESDSKAELDAAHTSATAQAYQLACSHLA
jgi:hypothetical protein